MKTVEELFHEWWSAPTGQKIILVPPEEIFAAGYAAKIKAPQWQPIESAPKDGTHILVCTAGSDYYAVTVHWFDNNWHETMSWDGELAIYELKKPTHWIGIPPTPEAKP